MDIHIHMKSIKRIKISKIKSVTISKLPVQVILIIQLTYLKPEEKNKKDERDTDEFEFLK